MKMHFFFTILEINIYIKKPIQELQHLLHCAVPNLPALDCVYCDPSGISSKVSSLEGNYIILEGALVASVKHVNLTSIN